MYPNFFNKRILKIIKKLQGPEVLIKNFLNKKEVKKLIDLEENSNSYFVERDDGRKRSLAIKGSKIERDHLKWHPEIKKIILPKLKYLFPKFLITKNEFPPHFFKNEFPTVVHADTGQDKNSIIYKQVLIPLKFKPFKKYKVKTIIFDKNWFGPASTFRNTISNVKHRALDFTLKDFNGKFTLITNILDFKIEAKKNLNNFFFYKGSYFFCDQVFLNKIEIFINKNKKRYNNITNKHITSKKEVPLDIYKKYLTHQPREDFRGLKLKKIFNWHPGDLFIWDRTKLHCSNDFRKHGVKNKTGLAIFFSYPIN